MPNWCENNVTLRFPTKEEAKDFSEHLDRVQSDEQIKDEFDNDLTVLGILSQSLTTIMMIRAGTGGV